MPQICAKVTKNGFFDAMNPEDLQKLVTLEMPYGKHKGRLLQLMQEIDHNGLSDLLEPIRSRQIK